MVRGCVYTVVQVTGGSWWVILSAVLQGEVSIATTGLRCLLHLRLVGVGVGESSSESEGNVEKVCQRDVRLVLGVDRLVIIRVRVVIF